MIRRNRTFNSEKGFSLIEVMIAIAILSFIVMAIVSVTGSSQDTAVKVVSEDRQILQVETAMSRLEWDISQTYSPLYFSHSMEPTGLNQNEGEVYNQLIQRFTVNENFAFPSYDAIPVPTYKSPEKSELTFFTTSNRRKFKNAKQSHFAWVRYELLDKADLDDSREDARENEGATEEAKGKVLVRRFLPEKVFESESIEWDRIKAQVLLRDVEKLVFEYWNDETKKWTENIATVKQGVHVIRGVKVNLDWIDPDGIKRSFIRVFRPLYPNFEPENMYKLLKEANANTGANGGAGGANGGTGGVGGQDNDGDGIPDGDGDQQ